MPEPKQRGGLLSWKSYSKADDFPSLCQTTQGPAISGCNVLMWALHVLASVVLDFDRAVFGGRPVQSFITTAVNSVNALPLLAQ